MSQKILFIYYQNIKPGGVARVMINLANELCEKGNDVSILFLMEGENTFYEINTKNKNLHPEFLWTLGFQEGQSIIG